MPNAAAAADTIVDLPQPGSPRTRRETLILLKFCHLEQHPHVLKMHSIRKRNSVSRMPWDKKKDTCLRQAQSRFCWLIASAESRIQCRPRIPESTCWAGSGTW